MSLCRYGREAGDFFGVLTVPDSQHAVFTACRHNGAVRRRGRTVNVIRAAFEFTDCPAVTGFVTENAFVTAAADEVIFHTDKGQ